MIKPLRSDLARDMVLFDRLGNFLGPISEVTGEYSTQRYVIRIEEDSVGRMKRKYLKIGDYVYYYNCDRLHLEHEENRELNLIEMKRHHRQVGYKKPKGIRNQMMKGVINDLKDMRLESNSKMGEEMLEDDQRSISKNSKTIISMVMNSHCNTSFVGSAKEKQKRRKYKKAKARMFLNQLSDLKGVEIIKTERGATEIEDELLLGKRHPTSNSYRRDKPEPLLVRSTEYSRNSNDTDKKNYVEDEFLFKNNVMTKDSLPFPSKFSIKDESSPYVSQMDEEHN